MRVLDTDALEGVNEALGVGAPAGATRQTVFDDENLQQILDVSTGLLTRGRTKFHNDGLGYVLLENIHVDVETETASIILMGDLLDTFIQGAWPSDKLREGKLDLWFVHAILTQSDGVNVGDFDTGFLTMDITDVPRIGINSDGTAIAGARIVPLAIWEAQMQFFQPIAGGAAGAAGGPGLGAIVPLNFRVPRTPGPVPTTSLTLTTASTATSAFQCAVLCAFSAPGVTPGAF